MGLNDQALIKIKINRFNQIIKRPVITDDLLVKLLNNMFTCCSVLDIQLNCCCLTQLRTILMAV